MSSVHDMEKAEKTYAGFVTLLKWTVPITAAIIFFIVVLIA